MSELKELLLDTVNGINQSHAAALGDLRQCVSEADEAVKAVSPDFTVRLGDAVAQKGLTRYSLVIGRNNLSVPVGFFGIRVAGYPLTFETILGLPEELRNAEELRKFFRELMVNANSPFVTQLAYLLRQ